MKNFAGRFKLIVLLSMILFLYALGIQTLRAIPLNYDLQQEKITGVVKDKAGIPLTGVTVQVKGKNLGTITDINGRYSITAVAEDVLVFSYLGFKTVEEPVFNRQELNIQLVEDITALDAIEINAGYYHTTKRASTGNISRVTAEEIELQPVISPLSALQGRMAGVEITPGGSQVGAANKIRIRGQNSLREEGNYPLIIIDGIPIDSSPLETNSMFGSIGMDPLNNLNVADIKTIEVLKDADATAIYGSRGANGVVLITTKGGKIGGGLEARISTGVSTIPSRMDLLDTSEYLQLRRKAFENDDVEPNQYNAYDLVLWDQDRYTDWQDYFFGDSAINTDVNLAASGGTENTFFRLGGSFHKQGTVYPADYSYRKVTGSFNLNHTSQDRRLNLNLSVKYGTDRNELMGDLNVGQYAFQLLPNAPSVFNEDGSLNWSDWGEAGLDNPLAGFHNDSKILSNSFIANLGFTYSLSRDVDFRTSIGYSNYDSKEIKKMPARSYNPADEPLNYSFHLNNNRKSWIAEPQLIYNKTFSDLTVEGLLGATIQENENSLMRLQGTGYVAEPLIGNLDAAERLEDGASPEKEYRYSAVFARLGTNYKEKYFLNLTGRRDGSSRFGPDKRFADFGAVGAAWIFTEESFFQKAVPFISFGKLRGSYGTTGNDQIGDYGYLDAYEATPGPGGLYPAGLSNADYSWEINKKLEAAIELGLLKNRVNLGISWYRNRTSNQLVGYPLPAITGFSQVQANLPAKIENKGWEFEFSSLTMDTENFKWSTSFNVSFPQNELVEYPGIEESSYANTYRVGHPLDISLLYNYTGIDSETGLYTIQDVNEDGRFDYEDRTFIQETGREYFGGISNNLNYKNFGLQFFWQFVKQKGAVTLFKAGSQNVQRAVVLEALEGSSEFQRVSQSWTASTAYSYVLQSDFPITDASFLRLKTLSVSYDLDPKDLKILGMSKAKLYLHGQNLLTITPYEGMDPDLPFADTSIANLRTISGGIQLNF